MDDIVESLRKLTQISNQRVDVSDAVESIQEMAQHSYNIGKIHDEAAEALFRRSWRKVNPDKEIPCDD